VNTPYKTARLSYLYFGLLILLVLSPNLMWLSAETESTTPLHNGLLPAVLGIGLLVSTTSRAWVGACLLAVFAILAPIETWYIAHFGMPSSAYLLSIIIESDTAETTAYLQGLWGYLLAVTLLPLAIIILAIRYLYLSGARWNSRYRALIFSSSLVGIILLNLQVILPENHDFDFNQDQYDIILSDSPEQWLSNYAGSWPTGLPVRIIGLITQKNALQTINSYLKDFSFGAQLRADANQNSETIVLVIGESSRPDHWQIFGYDRETTPKLATLSNLILFHDVVTPWAWTRMAVPIIITRKPASEHAPFFAEHSVVSAFKEAGFQTAWLSNQSALGAHESSISLYAQEADTVNFYNPASYKDNGTHDDVLIPALQRVLNSNASRKFIVLHTLGSHFNYTHRYPESFDQFLPSRPVNGSLSLHDRSYKKMLNNAYDNSVLFTDYLLNEIIQTLKARNQSAALLYVSDHGENIFDDECNLSGHGHETEHDFRVPMLFWYSDAFAKRHTNKILLAQKNANLPLNTETVFHSLLHLADITLPDEDLSRSLFSKRFVVRPRWIHAGGGIDFNNAKKGDLCKLISR
jgi:glucan phosphoethanolaminetransferase (alkaline phosphatase superfamily)